MEARRGKGSSNRGSAASSIAAVGKENICPASSSREPLSASRSPLPEGFPRAPLQDITQILSPTNILPKDDDGDVMDLGLCRRGRKRSKCVPETQSLGYTARSECQLIFSHKEWNGLRKCVTHQAASSDVHVQGDLKLTEGIQRHALLNATQNTEPEDKAKLTDSFEEIEEKSLLLRKIRETEQVVAVEVLKTEAVEASCLVRSVRTMPTRPLRLSSSSPATRASSRLSQQTPKMSSIMKFR